MTAKTDINTKLMEIYENTIESGLKFDGTIKSMDYYNLFCKAAEQNKLYKMFGNHLCMFNFIHETKDAVIMIFSIPINKDDVGTKSVAERVMEVVEKVENCFVTLDYLKSQEVQEDKFIYVIAIKNI